MYISTLRAKKGITQDELAKEFNKDSRTIQRWESDPKKIPKKILPLMADYFGVTVDSLFDEVTKGDNKVKNPIDQPDLITPLIDYKVGRKPIPGDVIDSIVVELNRIPLLEAERTALYKELERDE